MASKLQFYAQMAATAQTQVTGSYQNWTSFLNTAARLYKYPFNEQIMIYAQRPEATACAEYDFWNERMKRYVKRGSKGIALVDTTGESPKLRYVFDVADTGGRSASRAVNLWQFNAEHEAPVSEMLTRNYDVPNSKGIAEQFDRIAIQLATEYWNDNRRDIIGIIDDSFLEGYDEYNIGVQFRNAASISITYTLMARCGLSPEDYYDFEDFQSVLDFNTPATVGALGTAVSSISQQLLRQIEMAIRNYERSKQHERTDLHDERRLPDPGHSPERDGDENAGQVRQTSESLPAGASPDPVQQSASEREPVPAPVGDAGSGSQTTGADHAGASEEEPRAEQADAPDGMGAAHEQPESPGGGSDYERADLQLNFLGEPIVGNQFSLFPTEAEQIEFILDAESAFDAPSAFSFSQDDIDQILRFGSNTDNARQNIAMKFSLGKPIEDLAAFLREQYHGGYGLQGANGKIAAWYADDGIHVARGISARYSSAAQVIPWEDAAARINDLLLSGSFLTNIELTETRDHEMLRIAESLWYLYGDLTQDARDSGYLSSLNDYWGVFPDATASLKEALADPQFLRTITEEFSEFFHAYESNHSLLRFRYHKTAKLLNDLYDLALPQEQYASVFSAMPSVQPFITDDELNAAIGGGSGFSDGKLRIYKFFQETRSTKERAEFLKKEYGIGGHSHALSGATYSDESHDAKGDVFKKTDCEPVLLSWTKMADRIDTLIRKGRYLSDEEQTRVDMERNEAPVYLGMEDGTHYLYAPVQFGVDTQFANAPDSLKDEKSIVVAAPVCFHSDEFLSSHNITFLKVGRDIEESSLLGKSQEEQIAAMRVAVERLAPPEAEIVPEAEEVSTAPYKVGDTVFLDDTAFEITEVRDREVELLDPALRYPVFRVENRENFERLLQNDQRNSVFSSPADSAELTTETVAVYPAIENGLPYDVVIQTLRTENDAPQRTNLPPASNFHITDDNLGVGGAKAKFRMNMDAINLLKELEFEGRQATPDEQSVLSRYVGWGGLADAFDERKDGWAEEFKELYATLSPEEYAAARGSTLNAHYTSPTVIRAIYDAVGQMGFKSGNILEPAMGIGNFFGMLPEAMENSRLYGVELDSISGRIAKQLYPKANIAVAGFETTDRRDFFDLAIGNVPFGDYKVNDKHYNKLGFSIHNYFFAKALDQVRPGGVVAFVTSRYTMDAKSPEVRRYLAQKADLLGAIRLPNNAFRANAGTDVVSDIIFLQKRDRPIEIEPDWVNVQSNENGYPVNSYFAEHPEMVLGRQTEESTRFGMDYTVEPIEGASLGDLLSEAVKNISGTYQEASIEEISEDEELQTIPADPNVKNFSYTVVDGEIYFRENSVMRPVDVNETAKGRIKGLVKLREITNELIEYQLEDYPNDEITAKQQELSDAYDEFYKRFGTINSRANARVFEEDSSYYLLCSLENVDDDFNLISKADMFTKRTIRAEQPVTSVDTPSEALAISIGERGRVELPFMAQLLGKPGEYDQIISELQGVIFRDPFEASADDITRGWHTADDYLSGNVRVKLQAAQLVADSDPSYRVNVEYLKRAQPKDLDASEIDVRLGATWLDPSYIQQFMIETFETPFYLRRGVEVKYSPVTAEWQISGKSSLSRNDVAAYLTYGTDRANAYKILEDTLNLKDVRIYDTFEDADGKKKRVLNKKETTLAQQKQQAIKDAFRDWIWKDPQRRETLVTKYNELFNSTRPREYDGSHIRFGGMNPDIKLRPHQLGAIAHVLYGGNTLLAHEVGAGKTFEMAASAMESKRLGLCSKSMFVVPNHLTLQWANEFLRLYPSAKLLVATKKDFETANRKKFCSRIATGDYDAVIIGHSQFEKIPVSAERQERLLQEQIDEITEALDELKRSRGENFSIKQLEKTKKSLQARLDKLNDTTRKDDVINFEQLGIDRLFVDESHGFKNLFLYTKMRNVAGLSTSEAQKSSDMFMKCRYMDELTGGRGIVFATGTPVSNSMTELYTVQRYLQYGTLKQKGLTHFDCWASTFGETTTAIELAPEGTGYRARTRFAKFFNLPELMNMFKEVADIKTSDQLDLPVPEAKFETVVVQPSEIQKDMVKNLSERAAAVHSGEVDASVDNMLCITSDGRKIGLDQRLMNPMLPDDPESKLNVCTNNVLRIYQEGQEQKLTQLVFCDLSTPKGDGSFNVYDDMKAKLIGQDVPAEEIAFIHDADTEEKKKVLFGKVRSGDVRVLIGSTAKMGAGTNCQDRLIAVHHLDVGWRPSDMTQRNGRIIRQGNMNKEVQIYQYVTEGTFDAYLYQTLENKQKFISQIMTSKSPVRSCDDVDEQALSYAEIKALCAGNPAIREKMDLDVDVARLKVLKADHQSKRYRLEDQLLKYFPAEIEKQQGFIKGFENDIQTVAKHPLPEEGFIGMKLKDRMFTEKADAGEAIIALCKTFKSTEPMHIGTYRGFEMELTYDSFYQHFNITLKGDMSHRVELGDSALGIITRLDNALSAIPTRLQKASDQLENLHNQQEAAKVEVDKPFPQEEELRAKSARLAELDAELNMDSSDGRESEKSEHDEPAQGDSVLDRLKRPIDHETAAGEKYYQEER